VGNGEISVHDQIRAHGWSRADAEKITAKSAHRGTAGSKKLIDEIGERKSLKGGSVAGVFMPLFRKTQRREKIEEKGKRVKMRNPKDASMCQQFKDRKKEGEKKRGSHSYEIGCGRNRSVRH